MPDREKVIEGVEHCFHGQECCGDIECPYYIDHLSDCCLEYCQENLKADVLALLKKQQEKVNRVDTTKVKTVQRIAKSEDNGTYFTMIWYECEECGHKINGDDIFCAGCGKEVDRSKVVLDA
jgi:hypothetical protein